MVNIKEKGKRKPRSVTIRLTSFLYNLIEKSPSVMIRNAIRRAYKEHGEGVNNTPTT